LQRFAQEAEVTGNLAGVGEAPQCANPLFLKLLLDELRVVALHKTLAIETARLLEAQSVIELYVLVFKRLEAEFRPTSGTTAVASSDSLLCKMLSAVHCSRLGLSEAELFDLVGGDRLDFSPLLFAVQESLLTHTGLITFQHDAVAAAVEHFYLSDDQHRRLTHVELAEYFRDRVENKNPRRCQELPYHLRILGSGRESDLIDFLSDLDSFNIMHDSHVLKFELLVR
jgi:hypothetical protein